MAGNNTTDGLLLANVVPKLMVTIVELAAGEGLTASVITPPFKLPTEEDGPGVEPVPRPFVNETALVLANIPADSELAVTNPVVVKVVRVVLPTTVNVDPAFN